jgi:hypothetical protein
MTQVRAQGIRQQGAVVLIVCVGCLQPVHDVHSVLRARVRAPCSLSLSRLHVFRACERALRTSWPPMRAPCVRACVCVLRVRRSPRGWRPRCSCSADALTCFGSPRRGVRSTPAPTPTRSRRWWQLAAAHRPPALRLAQHPRPGSEDRRCARRPPNPGEGWATSSQQLPKALAWDASPHVAT